MSYKDKRNDVGGRELLLVRLEADGLQLNDLVEPLGEENPDLGLLASEVWEALEDIVDRLRGKEVRHGDENYNW